jgi:hypothetical protein
VNLFSAICSLCLLIFTNNATHNIPERNAGMVPISVSVTSALAENTSTTVSINTVKRNAAFRSKVPSRIHSSSILNLFSSFLNAGQCEQHSFTNKHKRSGGALPIADTISEEYWAAYSLGKRVATPSGFIPLHFLHLFPDHNFW